MITYAEACRDPNLFGPWFENESWATWRVIDKALFGLPLDEAERAIFTELTGRTEAPTAPSEEAWFVMGRRSGKDVKAASIATWLATIGADLFGWRQRLVRGERGVVQLLAVDKTQAKVAFGYTRAFFEQPMLAKMVTNDTQDSIELSNGLAIEITTNDQRRVRGRTLVAAIFDEVAHWRSENTVSPDEDVYQAVKPSMATMPGAMLIGISSPHARKGLLYRTYSEHYGKNGSEVLVVQAPTWRMNPTVPKDGKVITKAFENDASWASAEYGAQFRADIEALLTLEAVQACVQSGVRERLPERQHTYTAFCDPSGGSADSMTLAIGHEEGTTQILDLVREVKPPFSPEAVVAEFATTMKRYRISTVMGDRYGGEWVAEQFKKVGIFYEPSEKAKSSLYLDLLPLINSGGVDLLDHDRLINQLVSLERRISRGTGRDIIDHPQGSHDDIANAVAGALTQTPNTYMDPAVKRRLEEAMAKRRDYISRRVGII